MPCVNRGEPLPNLRRARFARGWRQKDLAAASGVQRSLIAEIENGKRADPRTAKRLADALETTVERLMPQP
jgi:transcriptional regulator with XRE-family HTH domain